MKDWFTVEQLPRLCPKCLSDLNAILSRIHLRLAIGPVPTIQDGVLVTEWVCDDIAADEAKR